MRALKIAGTTLLMALLAGCSTPYVSQGPPPAPPKPVQLLFTFKTQGAVNARTTQLLAADVRKAVAESGLFTFVSVDPVPDGALLNITLDNTPVAEDAFSKGLVGGVTFGVTGKQRAGSGYVCSMKYLSGGRSDPVEAQIRQVDDAAIAAMAANNGQTVSSDETAKAMARRIVELTLRKLAQHPRFGR